jgi:predicted nucleic acid-binding protein
MKPRGPNQTRVPDDQMRKLRLYLDSSILGWSLNRSDPARFAEANLLLQQIAEGRFIGAYSWVSQQEIRAAPEHIAKRLRRKLEQASLKRVSRRLKEPAEELAEVYCVKKIVPSRFRADALHIAIATLWKGDALVSYNFEHIVSLETMVAVNEVNKALNLNKIFLCQPQEVIVSGS